MKLDNYLLGKWTAPKGDLFIQKHAITGVEIGRVGSEAINYADVFDYGRNKGGAGLQKMTFRERGLMIKQLALYLAGIKKKYYPLSYQTGATKIDSWIDIDGGIGTLFSYASLRKKMPDSNFYLDGEAIPLSKENSFMGHHIMVPKNGVVVHINAFNFPIWGMLEKIAVNLLAGVPCIVKPSEITSFLTQAMVQDIIKSNILPEGALQLVCGYGKGILDELTNLDMATFTGSANTGNFLKNLPSIRENNVQFNLEADSLNAVILGEDVAPDSADFKIFIKEVRKEMTVKAGQKCTAIRRIVVPENKIEAVQKALISQLERVTIGDPNNDKVRMGALVNQSQRNTVLEKVQELSKSTDIVYGDFDSLDLIDASKKEGAFLNPFLLRNDHPFKNKSSHEIEAFGPVSTLMPYKNIDEAIEIANLGKGSLVSSIVTSNPDIAMNYVQKTANYHGRILILNEDCAKESTGHGAVMPLLSHGGPGRAGGGEELGGLRGVKHYLHRTAIQGHPTMLSKITGQYHYGGKYIEKPVHVFQKHFEELEIGETIITHKHTVTTTDIVNFANVSGDNFYAHMDETSFEGTIFEGRVAHGYFVLAKAAGLFVEPKKGPVLLNYGIDECRFTKPVYPGMTIGVRFTVKEKMDQEKRSEEDIAKGIVKFLVDVYDETGETVALATILTMVKKLNQD